MMRSRVLLVCLWPAILSASTLQFDWGQVLARVKEGLPAGARILEEKVGQTLRIQAEQAIFTYHFHLPQAIANVAVKKGPDGKVIEHNVELKPALAPEEARLYAVEITYHVPIEEAMLRQILLPELERLYGKAANAAELSFDMENQQTFVRAYLHNYRQKKYLQRLVFHSISLAAEQRAASKELQSEIDRALKTASSEESRTLPAPEGLTAEMVSGE